MKAYYSKQIIQSDTVYKGKVIIAGAGPGDPELLTLKAASYLQQADVVLTDRLVSEAILYQWVNPRAEIVFVGKEGHSQQSFPQKSINQLLLEYAMQDKLVVRLKGGDVAFFSNVLDELQTLSRYHIPYEIIPGITAASGASAYAGMPLTARGYAQGVRMITQYSKGMYGGDYWRELAATDDTLVLYMSGENLRDTAAALESHGISQDKKIAVIEQATTPRQRVSVYELAAVSSGKVLHHFISPSLVIIGKVVNLQEQFQWFHSEPDDTSPYFRQVLNRETLPVKNLIRRSA